MTSTSTAKTTIRLALDWTPNTLHSGLFLAVSKGLYSSANLDVRLLPPDAFYSATPAKRLEANEVDLAICPSESVIAYAEADKPNFQLQAIYAVLQRDASAIVTNKDGYHRLRDLEDATYGSYNARYEDAIVRNMISADGGDGSRLTIERAKAKLSLFDELKAGRISVTWIFLPWEGVEAQMEDIALQIFQAGDVGIPYGYSPVIARNAKRSPDDEVLRKFVKATREGYEMAINNPDAAVEALKDDCERGKSAEFLKASQAEVNNFYKENGEVLGRMKDERWQAWVDWLREKKLVAKTDLRRELLYTNQLSDA